MISRSSRPTRGRRLTAAAVGASALFLGACGRSTELPQNSLDPKGPVARQLDDLIDPVFVVATVIGILVLVLTLLFAVKYRRRSDDDAPVQVHGNAKLELTWTIIPAAILFAVAFFTLIVIADINREAEGADVVRVEVIGHQWWWEYRYPDEKIVTANELHIPVGRPVAVSLSSKDVVHSFWPPKLAGKVDVIPGRINHMTIEAEHPGIYHGQCAEFCGLAHADMRLRVVAHNEADWNRWLAANKAVPTVPTVSTTPGAPAPTAAQSDAATGALLFRQKGCASCHTVEGYSTGELGPNLTHLQQRKVFAGAIFELTHENMRVWLRDPPGEKPGSLMPNLGLTEDEITKLIAYLDTLK